MGIQEFIEYWQVIKKRLWLIGLLMGVTLGTVLLISYLSRPVYEASASFQVTAPLPSGVSLFSEFRTSYERDELIYTRNNFLSVLQSEFVLGQVIEELNLNVETEELLEQVLVESQDGSDFIALRVTAEDPALAADIANSLVDKTAQYVGGLSAGSLTANKEYIQQLLEEKGQELEEARTSLIQFQIENSTGSPSTAVRSQETLLGTLKANRDTELAEGRGEIADSYDEIIAIRERELQELILLNSEYETLQRDVDRIESIYTNLVDKKTEAELKENELLSARFIQEIPASAPSRPLPRVNVKILLLAGIASLVLGVVIAFVLEYLDRVTMQSVEAFPREDTLAPRQDGYGEALKQAH
jgi:capsular polysaccharide biosynthesis protein